MICEAPKRLLCLARAVEVGEYKSSSCCGDTILDAVSDELCVDCGVSLGRSRVFELDPCVAFIGERTTEVFETLGRAPAEA